ncbi:hypothetical protein SARC_06543 [Sphaeroforma arctica JP610]|uniref:Potassium channel domain-containing protein n=1 Tax=Sphaeroforma arctica JP610 TaxID=667725 RepID=A0A0L0FYU5_9EUKA|nr:hypothetical protein SARC_06543 [Sphaeroforma arctica JP610]KNC81118.1 hypothetical protein SARC_06543 [Sphaeroforma arctica JP610]|eukprot:XP_014155020.1 hypothetical protein SARC_06543 [Sphaeroforma arctica JP610]
MTTYSSVGYGDYSPKTNVAKLLVMSQQFIIAAELISLLTGSGSIILKSISGMKDSFMKKSFGKVKSLLTSKRKSKALKNGRSGTIQKPDTPKYQKSYGGARGRVSMSRGIFSRGRKGQKSGDNGSGARGRGSMSRGIFSRGKGLKLTSGGARRSIL